MAFVAIFPRSSRRSLFSTLAVMNVGKQVAPLDDPIMAEFAAATPHVNALARSTPGFVWSYDNDDPNKRLGVPELRQDPLLMPQLSLWKDVDSLRHFAFKSGHAIYFKRRSEWFSKIPPPFSVLFWWGEENDENVEPPSLVEAFDRLRYLEQNGPCEYAFTFKTASEFVKCTNR